jgi:glutathione S-transferase
MLTLHHLEYSQSYRVLWLLEELAVDYQLKLYDRDKTTRLAPANYKKLSPLGTSPVITDGKLVLAETGAIFDYLLDKYPNETLRPTAAASNRTQYLFWINAAQGSFMPLMLMDTVFRILEARVPFLIRPMIKAVLGQADKAMVTPRMKLILDQAETDLGKGPWFAGDSMTAADMMLSYPLEAAQSRGFLKNKYPRCEQWIQRIKNCPSYQSAREKDGKSTAIFTS